MIVSGTLSLAWMDGPDGYETSCRRGYGHLRRRGHGHLRRRGSGHLRRRGYGHPRRRGYVLIRLAIFMLTSFISSET